ncbi:pterin-4a-carbinolamine dehydratase [Musca autumnalis]|uniref:pterin-4a-carbinolamine dehydratase n=1 Tax=Musca autumnalis TaxID=221902 RepID=UPI003CE6A4A4
MLKIFEKLVRIPNVINSKATNSCINSQMRCITTALCSRNDISKPVEKRARLVATTNNLTTIRNSSTTATVPIQKKKKMAKLTEQERTEQLQPLLDAGWSMVNGRDAIYREYIFQDFNQSFRFMTGVALLAEKMNHHPEWFNVYNKLQVTMSTHDVGGLSAKDIRMAKYMEEEFKRFV